MSATIKEIENTIERFLKSEEEMVKLGFLTVGHLQFYYTDLVRLIRTHDLDYTVTKRGDFEFPYEIATQVGDNILFAILREKEIIEQFGETVLEEIKGAKND